MGDGIAAGGVTFVGRGPGIADGGVARTSHAAVDFPVPGVEQRVLLWRRAFPSEMWFDQGADLPRLLSRLELTGGNILNVARAACSEARARGTRAISLEDTLLGVEAEVEREGRVFLHLLSGRAARPT